MKKIILAIIVLGFMAPSGIATAEISQAEQQRQAQRAYEAAAADHNVVGNTVNRVVATVKRATSRQQTVSGQGNAAVRG